jgi:small GTP-binding protein
VSNIFSNKYRATIGVEFALKVLQWNPTTSVRLQLWDIAGQERFGHMTRVYYKEAVGAMVVFDVTRPGTFDAVAKWKADLDSNLSDEQRKLPVVLLANKCDLAKEPLDTERMAEYCKTNGFAGWFETSAKEDVGIKPAFNALVTAVLESDPHATDRRDDTVSLGATRGGARGDEKDSCAC